VERPKAAGLTQTVVAQRLGKPPSYVAKYEGGDRRLDVLSSWMSLFVEESRIDFLQRVRRVALETI
jgi:transcriptional regulator with XRE-family HTH domain